MEADPNGALRSIHAKTSCNGFPKRSSMTCFVFSGVMGGTFKRTALHDEVVTDVIMSSHKSTWAVAVYTARGLESSGLTAAPPEHDSSTA